MTSIASHDGGGSAGVTDACAARLTPLPDVQQLRLEHMLLRTENAFLLRKLRECPHVTRRVTTVRNNAAAADLQWLTRYADALQRGDAAACRDVEAQARRRVAEMRVRADELAHLLRTLQADVRDMLAQPVLQLPSAQP